jgi:N-acetylglucosamine-6-phosphate deacetylase
VRAGVPGIHIEGPFIASEDGPRGAHDLKYVRKPDFDEFKEWQDRAEGLVKLVTVAPELEGALGFIEKISAEGVVASIGHTGAAPERIRDAVKAGARLSTHLGNGSHGLVPRLKNYIWEQLASDELFASIIADGFHLPDPVLKTFDRTKRHERLILISDVNYLAGHAPGLFNWGDTRVEIHPDGHMSLAGTEYLAGAGHLLDRCLAQYLRAVGCSPAEALGLCTRNPARLFGLPENTHRLAAGSPAHFTLFRLEPGRPALKIEACVIDGLEIHRHAA